MRPVGLLGGMSWESSAEYYRILNEEVARRRGGLASAPLVLSSVDFSGFAARMKTGEWDWIRASLVREALALRRAGARAILVATNTMHRFAAEIEAASELPLLHIADAAAAAIGAAGARRVGLLGTLTTLEGAFYRDRLRELHGIETLVPDEAGRAAVDRIIFEELCRGRILEASRRELLALVEDLAARGAEGVILGCTELPLILREGEASVPLWDTTRLHALAAVDFMLGADPEGGTPSGEDPSVQAMMDAWLATLSPAERAAAAARPRASYHFCSDEASADELGALVLAGVKRATASSIRALEATGERLPSPGDLTVVTDWKGRALCVFETTRLEILPLDRVGADFAAREGEGDGSLAYWLAAHRRFFRSEHETLCLPWSEDIPVLCEDFRVVWPR